MADITTAVLILHGEKDERVPLGQAYGFYRGLKRYAAERGRDAAQLVVYPREPHGWVSRFPFLFSYRTRADTSCA